VGWSLRTEICPKTLCSLWKTPSCCKHEAQGRIDFPRKGRSPRRTSASRGGVTRFVTRQGSPGDPSRPRSGLVSHTTTPARRPAILAAYSQNEESGHAKSDPGRSMPSSYPRNRSPNSPCAPARNSWRDTNQRNASLNHLKGCVFQIAVTCIHGASRPA
jgi:hypothetical protein